MLGSESTSHNKLHHRHRPQTTDHNHSTTVWYQHRHQTHIPCRVWFVGSRGGWTPPSGSQEFPTTTKHTTRPESPETHDNPPGRGINHSDYNRGQLRPAAPTARPNKTRHQASSTGQCDATAPTKTANTIQRQQPLRKWKYPLPINCPGSGSALPRPASPSGPKVWLKQSCGIHSKLAEPKISCDGLRIPRADATGHGSPQSRITAGLRQATHRPATEEALRRWQQPDLPGREKREAKSHLSSRPGWADRGIGLVPSLPFRRTDGRTQARDFHGLPPRPLPIAVAYPRACVPPCDGDARWGRRRRASRCPQHARTRIGFSVPVRVPGRPPRHVCIPG